MSENGLPAGVVRGICEVRPSDVAIIRSFARYSGSGTPGFVTDFIGTKTRVSYFNTMAGYDGQVLDYPIPGDAHYSGLEWAGTLRAVQDAGDEMVVLELGAGFGPWLVACVFAGRMRGVRRFRLLGLEGSKHHYEFMRMHFQDNGLNPDAHTLIHGIAAPADGVAEFPILDDPAADWGAVAASSESSGKKTERLRAYSLSTLLAAFETADLIHIDIQGHEADVVAAGRNVLRQKAKRLVIGTHSRAIEQRLFDDLGADGWVLEAEEPTIVQQANGPLHLFIDGCQVWRNPALTKS